MTALRVPPTSERMLALVDAVARQEFGHRDLQGAALADAVRHVSDAYRRKAGAPSDLKRGDRAALCARLRFFLPRDLPKIKAPLAELAAVAALPTAPVLRVLDIGAGLGTTSLGAAEFLLQQPGIARVEVDAFDRDGAALAIAARLCERVAADLGGGLVMRTHETALGSALLERAKPPYHLVLLGLVLNELGDARARRRRAPRPLAVAPLPLLTQAARWSCSSRRCGRRPVRCNRYAGLFAAPPRARRIVFAPCLHHDACPSARARARLVPRATAAGIAAVLAELAQPRACAAQNSATAI